ncbi:uncharacterized protein RHO25_003950 [Cercospora beticola]|uniref:BTB domain-containing protein n=1 Tax=Cercospora beticola TaxID=122368 RepID=A0ABZ0NIF2_CERBT|nr:hypothetical protein RHO25_003950 [Cercospora beticola]CAK1360658.1 unnamed protein product [Cercospora beticola]
MANTAITTIASDGDVILTVGAPTDSAMCRKMRVSAATLTAISPLFKTLFGPHFREGRQARNSSKPAEIPLPEDDPLAVLVLCQMAHMCSDNLRTLLDSPELLSLAITVDKYRCVTPLKLQCSALLLAWCQYDPVGRSTYASSLEQDLWRMASAAYLIDCPHTFEKVTSMLVTHTWSKFDFLSTEALPAGVTAAVAEKRSTARQVLNTALPALSSASCVHVCKSKHRDFMQKLSQLFELKFWPPTFDSRRTSLQALVEKTRNLPTIRHKDYGSCEHHWTTISIESKTFQLVASQVAAECTGLCLACAKASNITMGSLCVDHAPKR